MPMWLFWLRQRGRVVAAGAVATLAVALLALIGLGGSTLQVTFLGHVGAPRATNQGRFSTTTLPASGNGEQHYASLPDVTTSLLDQPIAVSDPQTVAEAQAAWSIETLQQHQTALLAAVNCARQQQGEHELALDTDLTATAGEAWLRLSRDHSFSLMQLHGHYALRSVLPLDVAPSNHDVGAPAALHGIASPRACAVAGFDATVLPAARDATRVGIAVFPPQAAWDMASAVILAR